MESAKETFKSEMEDVLHEICESDFAGDRGNHRRTI